MVPANSMSPAARQNSSYAARCWTTSRQPRRDRCGRRRRGHAKINPKNDFIASEADWHASAAWMERPFGITNEIRAALAAADKHAYPDCAWPPRHGVVPDRRSALRITDEGTRDVRMVRRGRQSALVDRVEDRPAREPQGPIENRSTTRPI